MTVQVFRLFGIGRGHRTVMKRHCVRRLGNVRRRHHGNLGQKNEMRKIPN